MQVPFTNSGFLKGPNSARYAREGERELSVLVVGTSKTHSSFRVHVSVVYVQGDHLLHLLHFVDIDLLRTA